MDVLVTGGAGYIGSHTCIELLNNDYKVIVVDNLSNSSLESLNRVKAITGKDIKFYEIDLLDKEGLDTVFSENSIDVVIHFAGLKAVGESVKIPICYYQNNITGFLNLCETMQKYHVKKIVFGSSTADYSIPKTVPVSENYPLESTNPDGRSKLMIKKILQDLYQSDHN